MKQSNRETQQNTIYKHRSRLKVLILVISMIIGLASVYYTNDLVKELKVSEQRFVNLFAKAMESIVQGGAEISNDPFQELIVQNYTIPLIWADSEGNPIAMRNLGKIEQMPEGEEKQKKLKRELQEMKEEHEPIKVTVNGPDDPFEVYQYIYYKNSVMLTRLQYYPYVQLSVIGVFAALVYLAFSYSKTAEQNRVWAGLAKETAHQLGTPLSSLMAWIEYLKMDPNMDPSVIEELNKDIHKLEMITSRFSNIGSVPVLVEENMNEVISSTIAYLEKRLSSKVKITLHAEQDPIFASINKPLFDWVIENLCKNAVDAMKGNGRIDINLQRSPDKKVIIDVSDTGSGLPKSSFKQVFQPGFTTKKRGWGLGLTLVKRIVENYHRGKIMVKSSDLNIGTTFRIILSP
ncbi:sensor histidine kinase [Xanthovirga aplysinae]|uniref:sensor histidine kinase n=1 Tax=Xanthovirga aplysinae TaxID=2529853 RepID=UPI0012BD6C5D|nr:ATP-binding protein [Xanthovirga aplysinae]MTI32350.1 histidine kinase [Xanthovirga aplysinae]